MLTRRLVDALRLGRSLLMLEGDREGVDWEVEQDEPARVEHPHRAPLQSRLAARRIGQGEPAVQPCLSPVHPQPTRARSLPRRSGARADARRALCAQLPARGARGTRPR
jgi:hypothetical protein